MPVAPTYPGVYVEEVPSGVRTIVGVATSITAFVGRTRKGPKNRPVTVNSIGDFTRVFGGLWADAPMTYAVNDFFRNGGGQAIVVRLYKPPAGGGVRPKALVRFEELNDIVLQAVDEGSWGAMLRATIDPNVTAAAADQYSAYGLTAGDLFNLSVTYGDTVENHTSLSFKDGPRRIDRVLAATSRLVRWGGASLESAEPSDLPTVPTEFIQDMVGTIEAKITDLDVSIRKLKNELVVLEAAAEPDDDAIAAKNEEITAAEAERTTEVANLSAAKAQSTGSDSLPLQADVDFLGSEDEKTGLYALEDADLFNLLCIPPDQRAERTPFSVYQAAMAYCVRRRAMLILDSPAQWGNQSPIGPAEANKWLSDLGLSGTDARNAALYFPRVTMPDPERDGQLDDFVPCGIVAGVISRTDVQRGVWKAPAGLDAALNGVQKLQMNVTDAENGTLNQRGINCLRSFPVIGTVVWARAPCAAPINWLMSTNMCRSGGWRSTSKRASSAAPNGLSSSPMMSRCGRRFGSTSAPSCTICSGGARFRDHHPAMPIS